MALIHFLVILDQILANPLNDNTHKYFFYLHFNLHFFLIFEVFDLLDECSVDKLLDFLSRSAQLVNWLASLHGLTKKKIESVDDNAHELEVLAFAERF